MGQVPAGFSMFPRGFRRRVREALRPYARRLFEAYFDDYMATRAGLQGSPVADPGDPYGTNRHRFALEIMHSEFADAKHNALRAFQKNFVIPKPDPKQPLYTDGFPTPPQHLWVGYADNLELFLQIGRNNINNMRNILRQGGRDIQVGDRVLDFGCAGGPQIRNLAEFTKAPGEVWGVDIDAEHVWWCMQNLMPPFKFALTSTFFHLPFEDHFFDLAYCGSVFSHMAESADAWLLELARIIRPGGRLYLTFNTTQSMKDYLQYWVEVGFSKDVRAGFTQEQIDSDFDMLVANRSPWMHSVFNQEFFLNKCRMMFDVVSVTPNAYSFQSAVLLQRRDTRRVVEPTTLEVSIPERGVPAAAR